MVEDTHGYCHAISGGDKRLKDRLAASKYTEITDSFESCDLTADAFDGSFVTRPDFSCALFEKGEQG